MLGACYLTEWTEGIGELYEIGSEVETYKDAEELRSKIEGLKEDKLRRQSMRQRAQDRALADHTVAKSLEKIGRHLGIS